MKYWVTYKVYASYVAAIEANSLEEAKAKAEDEFCDADFGECVDIEGEPTLVEDEQGNFVWEH